MAVLILDSEALSALARPHVDPARHQRVRATMRTAHERRAPVRIPSAVLVEVYRGRGSDEAIDVVIGRGFAQVVTTGARTARIAGHLLSRIDADSAMAIDALVVATAIRFGGGMIATHDPSDLRPLAAGRTNISIVEI